MEELTLEKLGNFVLGGFKAIGEALNLLSEHYSILDYNIGAIASTLDTTLENLVNFSETIRNTLIFMSYHSYTNSVLILLITAYLVYQHLKRR